MGVKGKGLRSDGLHKSYVNGSPGDHNGASHGSYGGSKGANTNISNKAGLNKAYGNAVPCDSSPGCPTGVGSGYTKRIGSNSGE